MSYSQARSIRPETPQESSERSPTDLKSIVEDESFDITKDGLKYSTKNIGCTDSFKISDSLMNMVKWWLGVFNE